MSDPNASASFAHREYLDSLRANLWWALKQYGNAMGQFPIGVSSERISLGSRRPFVLEHPGQWLDGLQKWNPDELLRARDTVWQLLTDYALKHNQALPEPPWQPVAPGVPDRSPCPFSKDELESRYRRAFRELRERDGMAEGDMDSSATAAEMGFHRATLARWRREVGLETDFRALRRRLLRDLI